MFPISWLVADCLAANVLVSQIHKVLSVHKTVIMIIKLYIKKLHVSVHTMCFVKRSVNVLNLFKHFIMKIQFRVFLQQINGVQSMENCLYCNASIRNLNEHLKSDTFHAELKLRYFSPFVITIQLNQNVKQNKISDFVVM